LIFSSANVAKFYRKKRKAVNLLIKPRASSFELRDDFLDYPENTFNQSRKSFKSIREIWT